MPITTKDNAQLDTARKLRKEMTPQERKLWYMFLRKYPVKVYKQRIIDRFVVDFYCASAKLVIEIDGIQHYDAQGKAYDQERSAILEAYGLKVVRYSNTAVDLNFAAVCEDIDRIIRERRGEDSTDVK
ncbi:MAG: endonuclease domain-containing protein [Clostridia bacterium]|nr:endonuclease domain-containing protein [Clostridia bacterium]